MRTLPVLQTVLCAFCILIAYHLVTYLFHLFVLLYTILNFKKILQGNLASVIAFILFAMIMVCQNSWLLVRTGVFSKLAFTTESAWKGKKKN